MIVYKTKSIGHELITVEIKKHHNPAGVRIDMNVNLKQLKNLISKRSDEIDRAVAGTGYIAKTVIGVGTFLLDNEGDLDLMTAKQKVIFEKFLQPLLQVARR